MNRVLSLVAVCACVGAWADEAPIGVFDSGLGGLTVLERLLDVDQVNNATGLYGPDGVPDLARERFVYLGDQANMPYGDYAAEGKSDYLRELILKDAKFLLSPNYYRTADERMPSGCKPRAKIIVIACNTATAWGLDDVRKYLASIGDNTKVVGVIEAGVRAALDQIGARPDSSPFAVGVMATPGTIASGAYERTIRAELKARGVKADVRVVSQGCAGLADAIECGSPAADAIAKSNLVALVERQRASAPSVPMKAIILGCTHFPFVQDALNRTVADVRCRFPFRGSCVLHGGGVSSAAARDGAAFEGGETGCLNGVPLGGQSGLAVRMSDHRRAVDARVQVRAQHRLKCRHHEARAVHARALRRRRFPKCRPSPPPYRIPPLPLTATLPFGVGFGKLCGHDTRRN